MESQCPRGSIRGLRVVRHYDDRSALTACLLKGRQNLGARLRVEIPCRFVGNGKVAQEIVDNMVAFAELIIE